jgi:hypothetical protein
VVELLNGCTKKLTDVYKAIRGINLTDVQGNQWNSY